MYLPIVRRKKSPGMSARFSAKSVSITPICGCSIASTKPDSCQNSRDVFHACSGVALTTSQRSLPARTILASGVVGRNSERVPLFAPAAASPVAVDTLYRSSYLGVVRSGGSSSCGALATDL